MIKWNINNLNVKSPILGGLLVSFFNQRDTKTIDVQHLHSEEI